MNNINIDSRAVLGKQASDQTVAVLHKGQTTIPSAGDEMHDQNTASNTTANLNFVSTRQGYHGNTTALSVGLSPGNLSMQ